MFGPPISGDSTEDRRSETIMENTQKPSGMPIHKYRPYHEQLTVSLPDRTWPDARITQSTRW